MNGEIYLAGISGSLRKGSFNTLLLKAVSKLLPDGISMAFVSIADIPLYNADLDQPEAAERPLPVKRFREMLSKADGLVIVSPEYNYSIPGGLKNALDWASRGTDSPLLHKPIALMGATTGLWGTVRMQMNFHSIFLYLNMRPVYKPEIFLAQADRKFDKEGNLADETTKKLIREKIAGLKEIIVQTKAEVLH